MDEFSLSAVSQWRGLHRTDQTLYTLFFCIASDTAPDVSSAPACSNLSDCDAYGKLLTQPR